MYSYLYIAFQVRSVFIPTLVLFVTIAKNTALQFRDEIVYIGTLQIIQIAPLLQVKQIVSTTSSQFVMASHEIGASLFTPQVRLSWFNV